MTTLFLMLALVGQEPFPVVTGGERNSVGLSDGTLVMWPIGTPMPAWVRAELDRPAATGGPWTRTNGSWTDPLPERVVGPGSRRRGMPLHRATAGNGITYLHPDPDILAGFVARRAAPSAIYAAPSPTRTADFGLRNSGFQSNPQSEFRIPQFRYAAPAAAWCPPGGS